MSYVNPRRKRRKKSGGLMGLLGLGDVSSCGPDQVWDPNVSFYGTQGQCMPRANYRPEQLENPNAVPGVVKTTGAISGGSDWTKLLGGLLANATKPTTPAPYPYPVPASSGMSTGTMLMLGALGLGIVYVATK